MGVFLLLIQLFQVLGGTSIGWILSIGSRPFLFCINHKPPERTQRLLKLKKWEK